MKSKLFLIILLTILSHSVKAETNFHLEFVTFNDGTRCVILAEPHSYITKYQEKNYPIKATPLTIECDWKYGQLVAIISEKNLQINELMHQLKQNKRFQSSLDVTSGKEDL